MLCRERKWLKKLVTSVSSVLLSARIWGMCGRRLATFIVAEPLSCCIIQRRLWWENYHPAAGYFIPSP